MRKFLGSVGALVLATTCQAAHAGLFVPDSTFQVQANSSPDTFTDTVTLTPGTVQSLDGGAVDLTVSIVSAGGSNEWLVFDYSTTSGGVLSQPGDYWSVNEVGLQAINPVNLIAAYLQFSTNGVVQTPTGSIFGGSSVAANPVPGFSGTGFANGGYSAPLSNPLPALGTYVDPWSYLDNTGIDSSTVNGYEEALEFTPTQPVPESSTWAMMAIGFVGIGSFAYRRGRKGRIAPTFA